MIDENKTMTCDNCGNSLVIRQPWCHHCLQELAKYPLKETSRTRAMYELSIIKGLPEQDQERFSSYRELIELTYKPVAL